MGNRWLEFPAKCVGEIATKATRRIWDNLAHREDLQTVLESVDTNTRLDIKEAMENIIADTIEEIGGD